MVQYKFEGSCSVTPQSGNALTAFRVNCDCKNDQVKGPLIYKVYQDGCNNFYLKENDVFNNDPFCRFNNNYFS